MMALYVVNVTSGYTNAKQDFTNGHFDSLSACHKRGSCWQKSQALKLREVLRRDQDVDTRQMKH